MRSRNIVGVFEVMESTNNYYIIQELCDSDLEKYIRDHQDISEATAIDFLKQIVNGFVSLVREGIIHRYVTQHAETSNLPIYFWRKGR